MPNALTSLTQGNTEVITSNIFEKMSGGGGEAESYTRNRRMNAVPGAKRPGK